MPSTTLRKKGGGPFVTQKPPRSWRDRGRVPIGERGCPMNTEAGEPETRRSFGSWLKCPYPGKERTTRWIRLRPNNAGKKTDSSTAVLRDLQKSKERMTEMRLPDLLAGCGSSKKGQNRQKVSRCSASQDPQQDETAGNSKCRDGSSRGHPRRAPSCGEV